MRDNQRSLIEDGRKRYGTVVANISNATEHTDTCDFCGKDYQCARIKHDILKCPACGGPSTMLNDMPPTESELRIFHAKNHSGPFISCTICEEIVAGTRSLENSDDPKCARCDHPKSDHVQSGECQECMKSGNEHKFVKAQNQDEGQSKLLHEWVDGKCKTCGITKTENMGDMCNQTELASFPAPGMKNAILNSVDEGRRRYGKKDVKNSKCPLCKCDMNDHDENGRCDKCGAQCG